MALVSTLSVVANEKMTKGQQEEERRLLMSSSRSVFTCLLLFSLFTSDILNVSSARQGKAGGHWKQGCNPIIQPNDSQRALRVTSWAGLLVGNPAEIEPK